MNCVHYNLKDFIYIIRGDGNKSKRYKHWCNICAKDRGYSYKNKILRYPTCHQCAMKQSVTLTKISQNSKKLKHSEESKLKISNSLFSRYKTNPVNRKISVNLRSRLNKAIKGKYKSGSAVNNLGCSVDYLVEYLESRFSLGMNWANYGTNGWHIDHIKPLCSFDLTNEVELNKACHYTNLQPLWWYDNLKKRDTDGTF